MPNINELSNQKSVELPKHGADPISLSTLDLVYAEGQIPEETEFCKFATVWENTNEYYKFLSGFHGPTTYPKFSKDKRANTRIPNPRV